MRSFFALSLFVLAACAGGGDAPDDGRSPSGAVSCKPDEYVYCRLPDGAPGLQQCAPGGGAFGPCLCDPGNYELCTCADKSEGTKQCAEDGTRYLACECEGAAGHAGASGGAGSGGGGAAGAGSGGAAGQAGAGGVAGGQGGAAQAGKGGQAGSAGGGTAGAAGQAGASGAAGGPPSPNDTCPGTVVAVSPGAPTVLSGTTAGASDQLSATCATGKGGDVVYQITSTITGTLSVQVKAEGGLDAAVVAWTSACGAGAPALCANAAGAGGVEAGTFPITASKPVWVAVDAATTDGAFELTLSVAPPTSVEGDKCPGKAVALAAGAPVVLTGDTSLAKADLVGAAPCDKTNSTNDVVYAVTPSAGGTLTATLTPTAPFDGVLYARSGACTTGAQQACSAAAGPAGAEELTMPVTAGATYSVVVDGQSGSSGGYSLSLSLSTTSCGDGVVTKGEQCDDKNSASGDGCFACKVEQAPADGDCPGQEVHVFDDATIVSGTTVGYAAFDKGTCGGDTAKERFYQVVPHATGTLRAEITTASFDAVLYARAGACFGASSAELACDDVIGNGKERVDVPVQAGVPIWLAIDGFQGATGTYALSLTIF